MKHDKIVMAMLLGIIASIPYELFTRLLLALRFAKYSVYQLNSFMITLNRPTALLGAAIAIVLCSLISLIFYFFKKILGQNYLIIKAIAISLISWIILEVMFMWLIEGRNLIPYRPVNDYYAELFGSIIYGIILGLLHQKYMPDNKSKA